MNIKNKCKEELEKVKPSVKDLSESEKAQYEKCKICTHSYWWPIPGSDNEELECMFLREGKVLVAMKPGIECELFEENFGCMYCAHRRGEPKTLINGEKLVLCERVRSTVDGFKVNLGWERMDKENKCGSYCWKEEKE